jgi:hypothetical protein
VVDPPARGVTSRSRKRGSLAGASESPSGGERHGARLATQSTGWRATPRRETLEAPELRSLRPAKQDELLPQRQVLEREVSAGSERRTQRAQQSDYEDIASLARTPMGHRPGFWQTTADFQSPLVIGVHLGCVDFSVRGKSP